MTKVSFNGLSPQDFGFVLTECNISPPKAKTNFVDVPGRNGSLDITEGLDTLAYDDRQLDFTFVRHGKLGENIAQANALVEQIHGQRRSIVIDGLKGRFEGRCDVQVDYDTNLIEVKVKAKCFPYRLIDKQTKMFTFSSSTTIYLENDIMPAFPVITSTAPFKLTYKDTLYSFGKVSGYQSNIRLDGGSNKLQMTANRSCTVTFEYIRGTL